MQKKWANLMKIYTSKCPINEKKGAFMKVTFFIGGLKGGGAERVICNLANELVNDYCEAEILTVKKSENYGIDKRIRYYYLEGKTNHKLLAKLVKLRKLKHFLKKNKTDVYVVFLPVEICMFMHYRKYTKASIILSERNDPSKYPWYIQLLLKYYMPKASGIVFQTEAAEKWYGIKNKIRTAVIPNPINPTFIETKEHIGKENGDIVGIGRLSSQKNWPVLLKAYCMLPSELKKHKLVIYGDGAERQKLITLCKSLGIARNVKLPGFSDSIRDILSKACIFVMSSDYEGMPNSLMEAMAMGVPCVSTDCPIGGPKYLIQSGINGILIKVGSVEELRDAMILLLTDIDKSKDISKNAQLIGEKLNPKSIYFLWKKFITSCL